MTDLRAEALAYIDQARAALQDQDADPRAALMEARRCIAITDDALAQALTDQGEELEAAGAGHG